jgi:hypothetical protein
MNKCIGFWTLKTKCTQNGFYELAAFKNARAILFFTVGRSGQGAWTSSEYWKRHAMGIYDLAWDHVEWEKSTLKLGSLYYKTEEGGGLTYLPLWKNVTNYVHRIKPLNNSHPSSFPLLLRLLKNIEQIPRHYLWPNRLIFNVFPFFNLTQEGRRF